MTDVTTNFDIWQYLLQVAPVVLVMGYASLALWTRNNTLIDKIHERDLANLRTLEQMLAALQNLERKGDHHFDELRKHITERIDAIKKNS
jgi:pantothenate synthetase